MKTRKRTYRRFVRSSPVIFLAALLMSLGSHFRVYTFLGDLYHLEKNRQKQRSRQKNVEVTFDFPAKEPAKRPKEKRPEKAEKKVVVVKKQPEAQKKPQEQITKPSLQAIKQKSRNPEVEAPKDPKYIARENQVVEEETVARVRSYVQDDEQPDLEPPAPSKPSQPEPKSSKLAMKQLPTESPASRKSAQQSKERQAQDRFPTYDEGSLEVGGRKSPQSSDGRPSKKGPNLKLSWSTFQQAFGVDQLNQERQVYQSERNERRKAAWGAGRTKKWREFKAAIENFVPNVKPGNQTALSAAASPFAEYLTTVHIKIHIQFADSFLPSLPAGPDPLNDPSLKTKLEIVINQDGSLHQVGIVESSGKLTFDYGAYSSVVNAQPFPPPPRDILSTDGRAYFRWGFYRNDSKCGTWNAEPYILRKEGQKKGSQKDELRVPTSSDGAART